MIRKIDFYGQVIIAIGALGFAVGAMFDDDNLLWAMLLLLPLGLWQLFSAGLITAFSRYQGERQKVALYWRVSIPCLVLFISAFFFRDYSDNSLAMALVVIATSGGALTAIYYMYLYYKFFMNPGKHFPLVADNTAASAD